MKSAFVDCSEEHLPALRDFLARMYRPNFILRVNEDFLRWQFKDSPFATDNHIRLKLALLDDDIAGCLGYVPTPTVIGGRTVSAAWVMNWMIDEKLRKLGLGPFLMREVGNQYEALLDVGANADARSVLTRMGWVDYGHVIRHLCVFDVALTARLTESGTLEWPGPISQGLLNAPPGGDVRIVDRFGPAVTQVWDRAWGGIATGGTSRSMEFLNWRYADHPVFRYRLFEAYRHGRLNGVGVYRLEQVHDPSVRLGRIVELISDEGEEATVLNAMMEDARAQGVAAIDFICSSKRIAGVMQQHGFLPDDDPVAAQVPVLFQPINRLRKGFSFLALLTKIPEARNVKDWYVTSADGDQDRPN